MQQKAVSQAEIDKMHRFVRYVIAGCLLLCVLVILGCHACMKSYPDDNILEESLEEVIKKQYGIELDLSPVSMET